MLQLRKGTNTERLSVTLLSGELSYCTDTKRLYVGDGSTVGGIGITEQALQLVSDRIVGNHAGIRVSFDTQTDAYLLENLGGVDSLSTLNDVEITAASSGHVLKYIDNVGWVNGQIGTTALSDVSTTTPSSMQVLTYNSDTSKWQPQDAVMHIQTGEVLLPVNLTVYAADGVSWDPLGLNQSLPYFVARINNQWVSIG